MNSKTYLWAIIATVFLQLISCEKPANPTAKTETPTEPAPATGPTPTPESFTISPRLIRNDGSFELLAIIEGVNPNSQFIHNLQVITNQRVELKKLKAQREATILPTPDHNLENPKDKKDETSTAVDPKLIELSKKIEDLENKFKENSELMQKNYGYDITQNYLFIPIQSSLMQVKANQKELIIELSSPSQYNRLQALRNEYADTVKAKGKESTEAKDAAARLIKEFSCDVNSNYVIDIHKSALYRKAQ